MSVDSTAPKKVLVVEDDQLLCQVLKLAFELDGHDTEFVHNGEDAMAKLQREKYDLVLADYVLPGADGAELAHKSKENPDGPLFILMSGYVYSDPSTDTDYFFQKPFELDSLRHEVNRILNLN